MLGIGAGLVVAGCSPELPGGDDLELSQEQVEGRNVAAQKVIDYGNVCEDWKLNGNNVDRVALRRLDAERTDALSSVGLTVRARLHCVNGEFRLEVLDD